MTADSGLQLVANLLRKAWVSLLTFFQDHGWTALLTVIFVWYVTTTARPYYMEWANRRAIRSAQRKERVEVLDDDLRRVRLRQQAQYETSTPRSTPAPRPSPAPLTTGSGHGGAAGRPARQEFMPLQGGGGVSGFRSSRQSRARRG